jgi:hypothetical protein
LFFLSWFQALKEVERVIQRPCFGNAGGTKYSAYAAQKKGGGSEHKRIPKVQPQTFSGGAELRGACHVGNPARSIWALR